MITFITALDASGTGLRFAVKDLIDIEGTLTTAGSRVVELSATPQGRRCLSCGRQKCRSAACLDDQSRRACGAAHRNQSLVRHAGERPFGQAVSSWSISTGKASTFARAVS